MLRQVLTSAEITYLGLDVAADTLPQPDYYLTLKQYIHCRSLICISFICTWAAIISFNILLLSSTWIDTKKLLIFFVGLVIKLSMLEACLVHSLKLPFSYWDYLRLSLSFSDKLVLLCDMALPVIAISFGFYNIAMLAGTTCFIAYICLLGLQQIRIILSLFNEKDDYATHNIQKFFKSLKFDKHHICLPLKMLWQIFVLGFSSVTAAVKNYVSNIIENLSKKKAENTATTDATNKNFLLEDYKDIVSTRDVSNLESTGSNYINENIVLNTSRGNTPKSCVETGFLEHDVESLYTTDYASVVTTSVQSSVNQTLLNDPIIYSLGFQMTMIIFTVIQHLNYVYNKLKIHLYRSWSPELSSLSDNSTVLNVINQWLNNYEQQLKSLVPKTKVMQLCNAAHITHLFQLQNSLNQNVLHPESKEPHEFSVAIVSLGRCFVAEVILMLLKIIILLNTASTFVGFSLTLSIIHTCVICFYNTLDTEIIQEILYVD